MSRKPTAISLSKPAKGKKSAAGTARKSSRKPQALPVPEIAEDTADPFEQSAFADTQTQEPPTVHVPINARGIRWGAVFVGSILTLASIGVSFWLIGLMEALFERHVVLGWTGLGLVALAALALLALILREFLSIWRLRKLESLRHNAEQALLENGEAKTVIRHLYVLYGNRPDMRWHLRELKSYDTEILDAPDHIRLAEKSLMSPLDAEAKRIIATTAKRVSVITALNPSAVLDILFVGYQILQMLRKLMALYGGKPGMFGALKLARMTATHLAVTGGLALSDTLLQQFIGKGIAGRLSTKLGEGTVNGIMATRIGLAAIELCRPLPFSALEKPGLKGFLAELFSGSDE